MVKYELFKSFIENKKRLLSSISTYSEAQTSQAFIIPVLELLGWNVSDPVEVCPQYSTENKYVDYALLINNKPKVFIEVKKIDSDLNLHQRQLIEYGQWRGVPQGVLTNGIEWWFYLPLKEIEWRERLVCKLNISHDDPSFFIKRIDSLLNKENVRTSNARKHAEEIHELRQNSSFVKEYLPIVWNQLIKEIDPELIQLLIKKVEIIYRIMADESDIREFLLQNINKLTFNEPKKIETHIQNIIKNKISINNLKERKHRNIELERKLKRKLGEDLAKEWGKYSIINDSLIEFSDNGYHLVCKYSCFDDNQGRWFWGVSKKYWKAWGSLNYLALIMENEDTKSYSYVLLTPDESKTLLSKCGTDKKDEKKMNLRIGKPGGKKYFQEWRDFNSSARINKLII